LEKNWKFDMIVRYVDNLEAMQIPEYITMDLQLAWQARKNLEFTLIGRNLLDTYHPEFGQGMYYYIYPTEVERSVFGKVTWRY
jgi:iron complex outermembrane recepter protein